MNATSQNPSDPVAGTPRVPSEAVQRRLIQFGDFDSAGAAGGWGTICWRGQTESGRDVIVEGRGYDHPVWERAHRSLVRSAIVQAAGRGRTLLENGCDVAVISTEESGFPLVNNPVVGLTETEAKLLAVLSDLSAEKLYKTYRAFPPMRSGSADASWVTTADLAQRLGLSERQTREILTGLESRRLVRRDGERGGWMVAAETATQ